MAAVLVSSNDPDQIGDRCRDRLNIVEVEFDRYYRDELVEILSDRADTVFKKGAVTEGVVDKIADRIPNIESSCRHWMQLLRRAGQKAERDCSDQVTVEDVEAAFNPARC